MLNSVWVCFSSVVLVTGCFSHHMHIYLDGDFCCWCSVIQPCLALRPHGLQYARLPCPSPSPRVCSSSCPLSQWCHPTISSSVALLSSCLQSFPASESFPMSGLFTSGGQSIRASASPSALSVNIQGWFPLGNLDWGRPRYNSSGSPSIWDLRPHLWCEDPETHPYTFRVRQPQHSHTYQLWSSWVMRSHWPKFPRGIPREWGFLSSRRGQVGRPMLGSWSSPSDLEQCWAIVESRLYERGVYSSYQHEQYCFLKKIQVVVQSLSPVQLFVSPLVCTTPGFPVLEYFPELAQIHVHWVGDAI